MYDNGKGVQQDHAKAVLWYRKAAEKGLAGAQYNLGLIYDHGDGITQDNAEAIYWYRKASKQGHADAQNNLGLKYVKGVGILRDIVTAHMWFNIAGANGHDTALKNRYLTANDMSHEQLAEAQRRATRCMETNYRRLCDPPA
jgi:hypothetical protein